MADLLKLKELIFESDNQACFIERERILNRLEIEMKDYNGTDKYALILSKLLAEVSTPINENDYFAGRVAEALPDSGMSAPSTILCSVGHMSLDYEKVLKIGLKGILEEIRINADKKGDAVSLAFAHNAEIVITAIREFTTRYAKEAERKGFAEMAKALKAVPFEALSVLTDKMNIYNYDSVIKTLTKKGIEEDVAKEFTYSACCTFDLNYHSFRLEYYVPVPQIFIKTLESKEYTSLNDIIAEFKSMLRKDLQKYADITQQGVEEDRGRREFVLDSILLSDSAVECRYACDGNARYNVMNLFFTGVATIGDSLMVLDKLVFNEKRYTYAEFINIVKNNFENEDALRSEILNYTKFGNDTENDEYTVMAGNAFLDAADSVKLKDNFYIAAGFYSLERENTWRCELGATPDGRRKGDPFSENQSPTYGTDKNGITSLLKSVSKLPFERTVSGGLNLTFSQKISPEVLQALIVSYFQMGGLHVGISVIDRAALTDAMQNPDKYKSLTVRLYGFSEYFISLPEWQQIAVLNRTEYK